MIPDTGLETLGRQEASLIEGLKTKLSCSFCKDYLYQPLILKCEHFVCRTCFDRDNKIICRICESSTNFKESFSCRLLDDITTAYQGYIESLNSAELVNSSNLQFPDTNCDVQIKTADVILCEATQVTMNQNPIDAYDTNLTDKIILTQLHDTYIDDISNRNIDETDNYMSDPCDDNNNDNDDFNSRKDALHNYTEDALEYEEATVLVEATYRNSIYDISEDLDDTLTSIYHSTQYDNTTYDDTMNKSNDVYGDNNVNKSISISLCDDDDDDVPVNSNDHCDENIQYQIPNTVPKPQTYTQNIIDDNNVCIRESMNIQNTVQGIEVTTSIATVEILNNDVLLDTHITQNIHESSLHGLPPRDIQKAYHDNVMIISSHQNSPIKDSGVYYTEQDTKTHDIHTTTNDSMNIIDNIIIEDYSRIKRDNKYDSNDVLHNVPISPHEVTSPFVTSKSQQQLTLTSMNLNISSSFYESSMCLPDTTCTYNESCSTLINQIKRLSEKIEHDLNGQSTYTNMNLTEYDNLETSINIHEKDHTSSIYNKGEGGEIQVTEKAYYYKDFINDERNESNMKVSSIYDDVGIKSHNHPTVTMGSNNSHDRNNPDTDLSRKDNHPKNALGPIGAICTSFVVTDTANQYNMEPTQPFVYDDDDDEFEDKMNNIKDITNIPLNSNVAFSVFSTESVNIFPSSSSSSNTIISNIDDHNHNVTKSLVDRSIIVIDDDDDDIDESITSSNICQKTSTVSTSKMLSPNRNESMPKPASESVTEGYKTKYDMIKDENKVYNNCHQDMRNVNLPSVVTFKDTIIPSLIQTEPRIVYNQYEIPIVSIETSQLSAENMHIISECINRGWIEMKSRFQDTGWLKYRALIMDPMKETKPVTGSELTHKIQSKKLVKRTMKYMMALCEGIRILDIRWLQDSLQAATTINMNHGDTGSGLSMNSIPKLLSPSLYEIDGTIYDELLGGPKKSRNAKRDAYGRTILLTDYAFTLVRKSTIRDTQYPFKKVKSASHSEDHCTDIEENEVRIRWMIDVCGGHVIHTIDEHQYLSLIKDKDHYQSSTTSSRVYNRAISDNNSNNDTNNRNHRRYKYHLYLALFRGKKSQIKTTSSSTTTTNIANSVLESDHHYTMNQNSTLCSLTWLYDTICNQCIVPYHDSSRYMLTL